MGRTLIALLVCLPFGLGAEFYALMELIIAPSLTGGHMLALTCLHLFSSLALAEGMKLRYPPNEPGGDGAWRTGFVIAVALPGFGGLMAAILVARPAKVAMVLVDEFISPMEYRKQQAEAELAAEADKGTAGVGVESIGEALKDADKAKRLGAVEALREIGDKQAVELLAASINNTVFEVRFHAVEALAGINKKFSQRIARAQAAVDRDPSPENQRELGTVYYEYATLEMEDESIQQHLYRKALAALREVGKVDGSPDVMVKVATCLERTGDRPDALRMFRAVVDRAPQNLQANLGVARLLFAEGAFDQLGAICQKILDLDVAQRPEQAVIDVLTLWAEGPEAQRPAPAAGWN